jgi:hypothetical protein
MANSETRQCQNCHQEFVIEPDDFAFYKKISVPPPTFCSGCRMVRRLGFRNERGLHKRTCSLCGRSIVGAYSAKAPFPVYCQECWWSDKWDPRQYAREYDFSRSFFEQFRELQTAVPRQHTNNTAPDTFVNSEYTNCSGFLKDCYLVFGSTEDVDCSYSHYLSFSKECIDNLYSLKCERCYECIDTENCYNVVFAHSCVSCRDSMFLFDCRNCTDCIGCVGLRNKSFYIFNVPYGKDAYEAKRAQIDLATRSGIAAFRKDFNEKLVAGFPRKYYHGQMNSESSGDYISNSEHATNCFYTKNAKDSKDCFWCVNARDVRDFFAWGDAELCYEAVSGGYNMHNCRFTHTAWENKDVEYSSLCMGSSDLFGCVGLTNARFCIFNTQYSEDDYRALRERIVQQMREVPYTDTRGCRYYYGEFFPLELSPFPYADTVAQERFSLSDEEIESNGYVKCLPDERGHRATRRQEELPDSIAGVEDSITDDILECAHRGSCRQQCTSVFRITGQELAFYRKMNLPLPMLCHNCRHYERLGQQNPLKLWHRRCMCQKGHAHGDAPCPNEFETSYNPERPEIVYCESCYNSEVA